MFRRFLPLAIVLVILSSTYVQAQAKGRMSATVVDKGGNPVAQVLVTVTTESLPRFVQTITTNKKGKFLLSIQDATLIYLLTFEKEGYSTLKQPVKVPIGDISFETFEMPSLQEIRVQVEIPAVIGEGAPRKIKDPALAAYNEGVMATRAGDLDLALEKLLEATERREDWAMALSTLALVRLERHEYSEAAAAAENTIELAPDDFKALNVRYKAYVALDDSGKIEDARRALHNAGEAGDAARRVFNEGVGLLEQGEAARAQARFNEALALDPALKPAHNALVNLLFQSGDYQSAERESAALLADDPGNLSLLRIRYDSARLIPRLDVLSTVTAELAQLDSASITVFHEQAVRYFDEGGVARAQAILEGLTSQAEVPARAFYVLGLCYLNTGRMEDARVALNEFVNRAPDDPDSASARALLKAGG